MATFETATILVTSFNTSTTQYHADAQPLWNGTQRTALRFAVFARFVLAFLGMLTNSAVLILQIKYKLFLKTNYIFGVGVNVWDLISSFVAAVETWYYLSFRGSETAFIYVIVCAVAINNSVCMCGVAVDRYLALVVMPFTYKSVITLKKYLIVLLVSLLASIASAFALTAAIITSDLSRTQILYVIIQTSTVIPVVLLYILIGLSLSKSHRNVELSKKERQKRMHQTRRIIKTFSFMLVTNFIFIMPLCICNVYQFSLPANERFTTFWVSYVGNILYNLTVMNYVINPLIYFKIILINFIQFSFKGKKSNTLEANSRGNEITSAGRKTIQ